MSHPHQKDAMSASAGKLTRLLGHAKHKAAGSPYKGGSFNRAPRADGMHDAPLPLRGTAGYAGNAKKPSTRHPKAGGKVPGFAAGGRADKYARGGKKGHTTVNITVQGGGKTPNPAMPPPPPPPMPPGAGGPNPMAGGMPPPGAGGGMPPGMPNMAGVPNMMGAAGQNPAAMMKGLGTPLGGMPGGRKQGGRIGYRHGGKVSGIMGENKGHWEGYAKSGSKNRAKPAPSGCQGTPKLYARGGTVTSPITGKGGAASGVGRLHEDHYYARKGKHGINVHDPYGGRS